MADKKKPVTQNTEEHKRLASVLKKVHADLRKKLRQCGGDFDAVWRQHCQDQAVLSTYAQSMKSLAEDHWTKNSKTRIDWCRDTINEYFNGGGLKKVLEKERKRQVRKMRMDSENLGKVDLDADKNLCQNEMISGQSHDKGTDQHQQSTDLNKQDSEAKEKEEKDYGAIADRCACTHGCVPAEGGRLRLLDVGSCYNPFLHYEELLAVGVDLSPACESVLRCDFLHLRIRERAKEEKKSGGRGDREGDGGDGVDRKEDEGGDVHRKEDKEEDLDREEGEGEDVHRDEGEDVDRYLQTLRSPVETLPPGIFHAVVFSLLLEYLPAPQPRWLCCLQAHRLLQAHGLLLVVTPDSHSQHRNAPMIRSWRAAIEGLGFSRWRYVKQEHLHCMAFRKLDQPAPYPPIPCTLEDREGQVSRFQDSGSAPNKPHASTRLPIAEGLDESSLSLKDTADDSDKTSGDFKRGFLDSAFVSRFSDMMYIPQDLCGAGEEEEEEKEEEFVGEEERQVFFSAAEAELPGFVSEDED